MQTTREMAALKFWTCIFIKKLNLETRLSLGLKSHAGSKETLRLMPFELCESTLCINMLNIRPSRHSGAASSSNVLSSMIKCVGQWLVEQCHLQLALLQCIQQ